MFLVLEKDVCFPEIKGLEGIFEIEGIFKLARVPDKNGTRAIFGKERKFFQDSRWVVTIEGVGRNSDEIPADSLLMTLHDGTIVTEPLPNATMQARTFYKPV